MIVGSGKVLQSTEGSKTKRFLSRSSTNNGVMANEVPTNPRALGAVLMTPRYSGASSSRVMISG